MPALVVGEVGEGGFGIVGGVDVGVDLLAAHVRDAVLLPGGHQLLVGHVLKVRFRRPDRPQLFDNSEGPVVVVEVAGADRVIRREGTTATETVSRAKMLEATLGVATSSVSQIQRRSTAGGVSKKMTTTMTAPTTTTKASTTMMMIEFSFVCVSHMSLCLVCLRRSQQESSRSGPTKSLTSKLRYGGYSIISGATKNKRGVGSPRMAYCSSTTRDNLTADCIVGVEVVAEGVESDTRLGEGLTESEGVVHGAVLAIREIRRGWSWYDRRLWCFC